MSFLLCGRGGEGEGLEPHVPCAAQSDRKKERSFIFASYSPVTPTTKVSLLKEVDQDPGAAGRPWEGDSRAAQFPEHTRPGPARERLSKEVHVKGGEGA